MSAQIALSKRLGLGFALALLPTAGFGSIAAIWIGVHALKKIRNSRDKLSGGTMAFWCIALGFVGLIVSALWFWRTVVHFESHRPIG